MDEQSIRAYDQNAEVFADRYENVSGGVSTFFPHVFRPGMRVLDIGCGSGRDVARLAEYGCEAWGVEPSDSLLAEARARHRELQHRLLPGALPDSLGAVAEGHFDGIVLSAVLMHIPDYELFNSAVATRSLLKDGGIVLLSVPVSRPALDRETGREPDGRLFSLRPAAELRLLFERLGFQLQSQWDSEDALGRSGVRWSTLILRYEASRSRPIDRIEGIVNRDRKTATYKLALLRSLSDIAQTSPGMTDTRPDGTVAVPLALVVDRWIEYYWSFVDRPEPIQQNWNGKNPAFWKPLAALASRYRGLNGFAGFAASQRTRFVVDGFSGDADSLLRQTRKVIANTIIKGPITFAGDGEFDFDGGMILMSLDLWSEFVLMGHWIEDSIVLRWAELTSQKNGTDLGELLAILLSRKEDARMDADARRIYVSAGAIAGAWTGTPLRDKTFDVDHIIPFALRRDSSLWNLVPETKAANSSKRDKLPTLALMSRSRERIIDSWKLLNLGESERFIADAARIVRGLDATNWESALFTALMEAVEATATLRGVARWAG